MKEKLMLLEQGKTPMTEWEEEAQKEKQVELKKLEGMKKVRKQKKRKRETEIKLIEKEIEEIELEIQERTQMLEDRDKNIKQNVSSFTKLKQMIGMPRKEASL